VTVFRDGDLCRLYYRGSNNEGADFHQVTCYAQSRDGVTFTRPSLGLFEWEGSKDNNIVWTGPGEHNFAPFLDENPACKPRSATRPSPVGRWSPSPRRTPSTGS